MYIKVKPKKSLLNLGNCAKLSPRFYGPFEVLARVGKVAYKLARPSIIKVHNSFHVSLLQKYAHDDYHVIYRNAI